VLGADAHAHQPGGQPAHERTAGQQPHEEGQTERAAAQRPAHEPALDHVGSYGITNLNIEYVPTNSHFRVALTATNLGDVNGVNSRYTDPYGTGQTSQQYIPPRQVIGTIAYSF